jgi:hypothetical protein
MSRHCGQLRSYYSSRSTDLDSNEFYPNPEESCTFRYRKYLKIFNESLIAHYYVMAFPFYSGSSRVIPRVRHLYKQNAFIVPNIL